MKKSLLKLSLGIVATAFGISSFAQTYTFTTCTATGRQGPTQGQVNTAYTSTTLQGNVTINTQGIQEWTVPATGTYKIEAWGATAGNARPNIDGLGRKISGEIALTQGTVLSVVVGQQGLETTQTTNSNWKSGGGGASWVYSVNTPYIIGGGGGGAGQASQKSDAPFNSNFHSGTCYWVTTAVQTNTNVGQGGPAGGVIQSGLATGAGGGGWLSDGTESTTNRQNLYDNRGRGKPGNFIGGTASNYNAHGGFGGGAAGVDNTGAGGGGGGYTGGPGGDGYVSSQWGAGGGGSCYYPNNALNVTDLGTNTGMGQVVITFLCNGGPSAALPAFTQDSVCLNDMPMALPAGTPSGGAYSGTGVSGSNFDPAMAGIGTHYVVYSNTDSCSVTTMDSTMIVVKSLPTILMNSFNQDTVCVQDQPLTVPAGTPSGGTYSGAGVSGSSFDPSVAGVGTHYVVYTATGTNNCSNSDSTMIVVEACVGINENASLNGVNIYPNPTNGVVTIDLGTHNGAINYSISTVEGRIVNSQQGVTSNNLTLDISNESKGIYLLKIEDATSAKTYKIIKE